MKRNIWLKFPIFLAVFFCLYAYGLIANSLDTYWRLKERELSRVVAGNAQYAATLGDYLAGERRFVTELAEGPEISNFLANQALGMSLHYGLRSSLDAVDEMFRRALVERTVEGKPLYKRFLFIDTAGVRLVDTAGTQATPPLEALAGDRSFAISSDPAVAIIVVPVRYRGNDVGRLVIWSDLARLVHFLLPAPETSNYRVLALTFDGREVKPTAGEAGATPGLIVQIIHMADGSVETIKETSGEKPLLAVRHAVPGMPLFLATIQPEVSVFGERNSSAFLAIAGVFPPLVILATLLFERMQRRNARVELALRASRLRLMGISDNLVEGIVLVDRSGTLLFVNRPALRLLESGVEPAALVGGPLETMFRLGKSNSPPRQPWLEVVAKGDSVVDGDATFLAPSGREIPVAYACTPFVDPEHGPAAIISFRDISAIKQAQREAAQSARLVSIGQLAAGIAHEINTPAQYITDNLSYIEDGLKGLCAMISAIPDRDAFLAQCNGAPSSADVDYLLEQMPLAVAESREGVAQIARIVSSMKEFSHPGVSGRTATDINRAIENTLMVSRNAWKHFAEVDRVFDPALPNVVCNAGEINQVFLNLILNAAQAIEAAGKNLPGRITITTRRIGNDVEILVADSGTGVPEAIREHIFDLFFTTKPVGKGTGQGLAICRDVVVVKHGGMLSVGGVEGEGAIFTVRLPIDSDPDGEDEKSAMPSDRIAL